MTTQSSALPTRSRAITAEWVLAGLAVLTFVLIPIQINTIYSGLPAHPLFLHVPVMLIPIAALGALVLAFSPRLFARHGIWVGVVTVLALGATNLTMGAGQQLRTDLHFEGPGIVADHAHAAGTLRVLLIVFTALLLIAIAVYRTGGPRVTGIGPVDRALGAVRASTGVGIALRVFLAVLALASIYYVFHTGDLGAKAVWQHRIGGGGGGIPAGPPGPGASPSGG